MVVLDVRHMRLEIEACEVLRVVEVAPQSRIYSLRRTRKVCMYVCTFTCMCVYT